MVEADEDQVRTFVRNMFKLSETITSEEVSNLLGALLNIPSSLDHTLPPLPQKKMFELDEVQNIVQQVSQSRTMYLPESVIKALNRR